MKKLFVFPILLFSALSGQIVAQNVPQVNDGKVLFVKNCTRCHGVDGAKGTWGAANLQKSKLGDEALIKKISNGGWVMPRWKKTMSATEILAVASYIKTLRN